MAFFDFLTGADEAADAIKKSTKQAIAYEQEGQAKAANVLAPGAVYAPAMGKVDRLLGLEGAQAQQDEFGAYVESPEVAFMREQGLEAAQRGAAAGGRLASGRTLIDLNRIGQGYAQQGYGSFFQRLMDRYKTGLSGAGALADVHAGGGSRLANLKMGGGSALAEAEGERGGALGDLLSQGALLAGYAAAGAPVGTPGSSASSYDPGVGPGGKGYPYYGGPR